MPRVQDDFHYPAHLVATIWPLPLLLSTAGFGIKKPGQRLGTISPLLQGSQSIAGSSDASPVGLPEANKSVGLCNVRTGSYGIAEFIQCTYHPCLGL